MIFNRHRVQPEKIEQLANLINHSNNIYAITGAGISTNAGIPDLQHLSGHTSTSLSSEDDLERNPPVVLPGLPPYFY